MFQVIVIMKYCKIEVVKSDLQDAYKYVQMLRENNNNVLSYCIKPV